MVAIDGTTLDVAEYEIDDGRAEPMGPFRLFTTMLDPDDADWQQPTGPPTPTILRI